MFSPHFYKYYNNNGLPKSIETREIRKNHQTPHHKSDDNVLLNPPTSSHIILIYENQYDLDNAIATFINEGLRKEQICVHASVSLRNEGYLEVFHHKLQIIKKI